MNVVVVEAKPEMLRARREDVLAEVGVSADELRERIESWDATPLEWRAWREIDGIDFLLSEEE
ncbi:hypothetical protein GCM10009854_13070 [Saccharopolyspora halophila]|uniref:Uncharacterized protein n=1 Tax=Saccharopolyspora halophila TaxID=405551 RepID=A0ABN3FW10_9PSEU